MNSLNRNHHQEPLQDFQRGGPSAQDQQYSTGTTHSRNSAQFVPAQDNCNPQLMTNLIPSSKPFIPQQISSVLDSSILPVYGGPISQGFEGDDESQLMQLDKILSLLDIQKQYEGFKKQQLSQEVTNQINSLSLDLTNGAEFVCCRDQRCSRFVQERLTSPSVDNNEKRRFLDRILKDERDPQTNENLFEILITDSFGNYVIQKILTVSKIDPEYQEILFQNMQSRVFQYSTDRHACRVMQIAFDTFGIEQQTQMVQEIVDGGQVKECSFNFHGNHVVQRIIINMGQIVNSSVLQQVIQDIEKHIVGYCINEFCCRIVQRMFEYCHPSLIQESAIQIINNYNFLCQNEYGIFVLSSVLEHGSDEFKQSILVKVKGEVAKMSLEKDGSKLIENCIKMFTHINGKHMAQQFHLYNILDEILNLPYSPLIYSAHQSRASITFSDLLTNKFSNYVIQKSYDMSDPSRKQIIIDKIQYLVNYNNDAKETPLKHILKHLQKKGIDIKYNKYQVQQEQSQKKQQQMMQQQANNQQQYQGVLQLNQYNQFKPTQGAHNLTAQFNQMHLQQTNNGMPQKNSNQKNFYQQKQ